MIHLPDEKLAAGREALRRHAWQESYELISEADSIGTLGADDLEALAEAAEWAGKLENALSALERAHCAHLEAGNKRRAAYVAMMLARGHANKLAGSVAAGWRARAERLLEGEPECVELGHLALRQSFTAQTQGDLDRSRELAEQAMTVADKFGEQDLWALAAHRVGQILLQQHAVPEGLALIDEASAAALSGELTPDTTGMVYCWTISACRDLADTKRAAEWTEEAKRWCVRQSISGFPGICRIHRAEILRLRGAWADAEREVLQAGTELPLFNPRMAGSAFAELGEIRLRMGDAAGAHEAFTQAVELGSEPEPGRSLLRWYRGDAQEALRSLQRATEDEAWDRFARARLLPALVEIALAANSLEQATRATEELEELARNYGSVLFHAAALQARAALQLAHADAAGALRPILRAVKLWREIDAPYEGAQARMLQARIHHALGEDDDAAAELRAAGAAFDRLGATRDSQLVTGELAALVPKSSAPVATRTFLFTDVVGSTNLIEAIGDEAWESLVSWHDRTLRTLFQQFEGEEVDHAGDGFFVAFSGQSDALGCAIAIQRRLVDHRRTHGFSPKVRIGVHAAEAVQSDGSYKGKGVHEAARIGALAEGGEILTSTETLLAAGPSFRGSEPRTRTLKGISRSVQICALDWESTAPSEP